MRRPMHVALAVVVGFILLAAPGLAAELKYSGFLGDYYKYLQPGPEGGAKMIWLRPGTDFRKYKKFMVDSVIFYFADDSEYKGIDPQEMKELADNFNKEIVSALNDRYPIVSDPGPDVMRLRFAITGVKQSRPVLSGVTSIVPVGLALSIVKKGATGSWSGSGATSGELMMLDTTTNNVIGVAVDERTAAFAERFSKWGSAEEAFKFWAGQVRGFMDSLQPGRP